MEIQACVQQVTDSLSRRNQEGRTDFGEAAVAVPSTQVFYIDRTVSPETTDARRVIKVPKLLRYKKGIKEAENGLGGIRP